MDTPPGYLELADKAGISRSYANEIIKGKQPSSSLAAHIFVTTGWKHPRVAPFADDHVRAMADAEPWPAPRPSDAQAA